VIERKKLHRIVTLLIALVWVGFGLLCKVLHLVPRHEEIVAHILGDTYAAPLTRLIGVSEILMAVWILSGYKKRLNAIAQMAIVGTMNVLEAIIASEILLFGHLNALFAVVFICVIYTNEWILNEQTGE
jgi:hypothetical protein